MENINFRGIPTSLFLNGPKLGIVTDPQSASDVIGVATFTGIATASFPNPTDGINDGSIAFKWYFDGSRILDTSEDSTSNAEIVGFSSATGTGSTITISGLTNNDDQKEVYFEADYIPSAYQSSSPVTAGTARSTGNAFNEPLQSGIGTISITPIIEIITQPKNELVVTNEDAVYTIAAQKSPGGGAVNYQWQLNGNDLSDGTTTRTVIGGSDAVITVTGSDGSSAEIDFSQVSVYDTFTPEVTYTLVADANVTTKLFATGGGGGGSDTRSVAGSKGGLAEGTFTFVKDQEYKLIVGSGGDIVTAGRPGGGTGGGTRGSSGRGGGGGYTGLFEGSITHANAIIIGGGGGGSTGDVGNGGAGGGNEGDAGSNGGRAGLGGTQTAGGEGKGSSGSGSALQGGNGSSAGAGGAGYYGGGGGNPSGTISDGAGGGGSGYIGGVTDGTNTTAGGAAADGGSGADGSFRIEFTATTKEVSTTVTGSRSDTLTINSEAAANGTIRCKLTATGVQESPVFSNTVSYVVQESQNLLNIETYTYSNATAKLSEFNFGEFRGSTAVCISVVDETRSQYDTQSEIDADWDAFRANYPKRPFWILFPKDLNQSRGVTLPTAWDSDPFANGPIQVRRDDGQDTSREDWFTITKLDQAPAGTHVSLVVDKSGSMTRQTVAASLNLFLKKCKEAGIIVNEGSNTEITMEPIEEYIAQHNRELDDDLNKLLTIDYDTYPGNAVCMYARDQDLNVEIDLYGGEGSTVNEFAHGGEGGYSKIKLTMKKDEEYVVTGLFSAVNTPFLYRKGTLIACVGAGGAAAPSSGNDGGQGGGIGISGQAGRNNGGGTGGRAITAGTGNLTAQFGSAFDGAVLTGGLVGNDGQRTGIQGGNSIICTRGVYWRNQGKAPCEDVGTVKFRTPDGTEISNTGTIARGYKSGYNAIQTGGSGLNDKSGDGGCGFTGGNGGDNRGGGGGSGYTDGSVTVVDTQLGGSTGAPKIVIRLV